MKKGIIALLAVLSSTWLNAPTASAGHYVLGYTMALRCPASLLAGIPSDQVPQGWTSGQWYTANFISANVTDRNLFCYYGLGTQANLSLMRDIPEGRICTLDDNSPSLIDCDPKPVATPGATISQTAVGIGVVSATYGGSCGVQQGNVTMPLSIACNGKTSCEYTIDYRLIGDPAPGCKKDYVAKWTCGGSAEQTARAEAEAGFGSRVSLICQ